MKTYIILPDSYAILSSRNFGIINAAATRLLFFALFLSVLIFVGCDDTPTELKNYDPEPVLSAFISNGEPVSEVWLERIAPLEGYYNPADNGIVGAEIKIFGGGDTLNMVDDTAMPGRYIPVPDEELIPRSFVNYHIEVITPVDEVLTAETLMPDKIDSDSVHIVLIDDDGNFDLVSEGDTLNRNMSNMYWQWTAVDSAGGYQGKITALTDREDLVPLDPGWDPNDTDDKLDPDDRGRVGWMTMRWDQQVITLPWIFFQWEGPTMIELYAISHDYYEYLFSLMRVQQGMINTTHSNIEGGLGIFGAVSKYGFEIYMEKVE